MSYAITGANGYLGFTVARSILLRGDNVNLIGRFDGENKYLLKLQEEFPRRARLFLYNGTAESLRPALVNVERLLHLAAHFNGGSSPEVVSQLVDSNIRLSAELFAVLSEVSPQATVVAASTWSAYDETGVYAPQNIYSATKKVVEDLAAAFPLRFGFLRFSDTYGPGDWRRKLVSIFTAAIKEDKLFTFGSSPDQVINLLHVEDIARAVDSTFEQLEATSPEAGSVAAFDLFYPENRITLRDLSLTLIEELGRGAAEFPNPDNIKPLPPQGAKLPDFSISKPVAANIHEVLKEVK